MKLKPDQNVHTDVAGALRAHGHEVVTVHDQGLAGRLWIVEHTRAHDWTP